ncbi:MAG: HU family DNA-binding protein [Prevotella sp.]|jgi:predicted histone-like DNA-binding protein
MAVIYKLYQIKNKSIPAMNGKWFAHPVISGSLTTDKLADHIQKRCTVTLPDILAVISALVDEIRNGLQDGKCITIDRLGTFRVGFKCKSVAAAKDFSIQKNLLSAHVLFHPVCTVSNKKHINTLLMGCKFQEMGQYDKPVKKTAKSGEKDKPAE